MSPVPGISWQKSTLRAGLWVRALPLGGGLLEAGWALPTATTLTSLFPGTLLDTDNLYDEEVCTPDNLQK